LFIIIGVHRGASCPASKYQTSFDILRRGGKKKNITGLTVICDQNTLHLSVNTIDNNRKTGVHDIKNVQKTLDKINLSVVKDYVKINLIGDKGYITKNKFTPRGSHMMKSLSFLFIYCFIITRRHSMDILNRNINIVTPKKKSKN
jgi:hypothetical protein